ncbi:MAG: sodium-dependent transporter [Thiohalomonadaceae bacterium]
MIEGRESIHGQWSGRWAFILAATGSAVGLGNIWKFPYITGENGGGAFVLVYLLCILLIGVPIMIAEVMMGRRGRRNPIHTMGYLAREAGRWPSWRLLGWMGVLAGFLILSYYAVIAGWALAYFGRALGGAFDGIGAEQSEAMFVALVSDPERLLAWHTIFMVMTMVVVARGVRGGLEKAVSFLVPALVVILLVLVGYAMNTAHFAEGMRFLFEPNFQALFYRPDEYDIVRFSWSPLLIALGHAFFTLSLGMGAIMIYGSYLPQNTSIIKTTGVIAVMDTGVAILAGMAIFPIVFASGLAPGQGPGLVFQTLPIAFGAMPGGMYIGILFFMLLVFAAWSSAISLIEPLVTWLVERHGLTRTMAAVWSGLGAWLLGLATIFSFNIWSGEQYQFFRSCEVVDGLESCTGMTAFQVLDFLTANIMLPLGGLLIAIFAGWRMHRQSSLDELAIADGWLFKGWRALLRYVAPLAVIVILLSVIGVIAI